METTNSTETLKQFSELIDSKVQDLIIPFNMPLTITEIVGATLDERYAWDSQKCSQNSLELVKYLFFIREKISKNLNMVRWLKHHLNAMHGKYIKETGVVSTQGENYTPYPVREKILNTENEKCAYLIRKILELESENEQLTTQANFVNDFHYGLSNLARIKNS